MPLLQKPDPFNPKDRGRKRSRGRTLPGQSDATIGGLSDVITLKITDDFTATIINRELVQVGNVGTGDYVEIGLDGIQLLNDSLAKIFIQSDGDLFIGRDLSDPDKTHFAIFANTQTYNSESMAAGDMLLGSNSAGKANIFWDASAGQMYLRNGTTVSQLLDGDGDFFLGSDTSSPDTTFLAAFANGQTYNSESVGAGDILFGSNSAGEPNVFWDASAGQLLLRIGTTDSIIMDSDGTILSAGGSNKIDLPVDGDLFVGRDTSSPDTTVLAVFATGQTYNSESVSAGDVLIGSNSATQHNLFWDDSAGNLSIRYGTTERIDFDGTTILVGDSSAENLRITPSTIQIRDASTNHAELTDGKLYLGDTSAENILISSASGISLREATTSYAQLSSAALRLGPSSTENVRTLLLSFKSAMVQPFTPSLAVALLSSANPPPATFV